MIQRIQTIFLVLVAISMFAVLFLPVFQLYGPEGKNMVKLTPYQLTYMTEGETMQEKMTIYIALLASLSSGLAVGSVFSYGNRLKQMALNFFNTLVMVSIVGIYMFFVYNAESYLQTEPERGGFLLGFYAVPFALICNFFANRFIRRDEQLVRSADRLR